MMTSETAAAAFKVSNPGVIRRALIVRRLKQKQIFLWSNLDPVSTIDRWKSVYGNSYSVRVVTSPSRAWSRIWNSASPLMAGLRQCRLG